MSKKNNHIKRGNDHYNVVTKVQPDKQKDSSEYELIRQAMGVPEIAVGLAMRVLALMKSMYMEIGIRNFPCLVYYGKQGCGKSSLAYAVLESSKLKINAWDTQPNRKKWLKTVRQDQLILVDDVNGAKGGQFSAKIRDSVNELVREMYNGDFPVGVITMEDNSLSILNNSAKSRMIFFEMSSFLEYPEKAEMVRKIDGLNGKPILNDFFIRFQSWLSDTYNLEWLAGELEQHEKYVKPGEQTKRLLDEQWMITLAMRLLCENLKIESDSIISEVCSQVFQKQPLLLLSREDYMEIAYNSVLKSMGKSLAIPEKRTVCEGTWDRNCSIRWWEYKKACLDKKDERCDRSGYRMKEAYVPSFCILRADKFMGVLFENLSYLLCLDPKFAGKSVLVINFHLLLAGMNEQFQNFCSQMKVTGEECFSKKELKTFLLKTNRCMFTRRRDEEYKTKTGIYFPFLVESGEDDGVEVSRREGYVWLLLEKERFDELNKNATIVGESDYYLDGKKDLKFIQMIKNATQSMVWGAGTIGRADKYSLQGIEYEFEE